MPHPDPVESATPAGQGRERKFRILQFAYGTSLYGAERWVLALIVHLDPARVETTVACIRDADTRELPLIDEAKRLGFSTLVLDGRRRRISSAIVALRRAIREHRFDLVHSHGVRQNLVSLVAARPLGCPIVSTAHGWDTNRSLRMGASDVLNKGLFAFFDAVAPVSQGVMDSLGRLPFAASRIHLIENGVNLSEVESATPVAGLLPGQSSADDFVIGYIGQLIPRKGVDVLVRALGRLAPTGWCCLILGDGPSRGELARLTRERGLQDRVRFLGFRPDRLRYLKRFDLLTLPSCLEGMPRTMMEALAAGIPCAGAGIPGVLELLGDGAFGFLFPPGDPDRLAEVIHRARGDRVTAAGMAEAGRAHIYACHSAATMARAYQALYERLSRPR